MPDMNQVWIDAVVASKEAAQRERDIERRAAKAQHDALAELVRLKDGPRDDAYRAAKDKAWQAARDALR